MVTPWSHGTKFFRTAEVYLVDCPENNGNINHSAFMNGELVSPKTLLLQDIAQVC